MNILMVHDKLTGKKVGLTGVNVDKGLGTLISSPYELANRLGNAFFGTVITTIEASSSLDILITTGDSYLKIKKSILRNDASSLDIEVYEGATVSANGTEGTIYVPNRISSTKPDATLYSGPTVDSDGTLIDKDKQIGTEGVGGRAIGSGTYEDARSIFKPNTNYILRITNNDTDEIDFVYRMVAFETEEE